MYWPPRSRQPSSEAFRAGKPWSQSKPLFDARVRCAPELQPHSAILQIHSFTEKIYADGSLQRKSAASRINTAFNAQPTSSLLTWYVLSNLSYMKRVMMEVFPTDWSPRNTNLNFANGEADADPCKAIVSKTRRQLCIN